MEQNTEKVADQWVYIGQRISNNGKRMYAWAEVKNLNQQYMLKK